MTAMRNRRSRRRVKGLFPRLGEGLKVGGFWMVRHPQRAISFALLLLTVWALWNYAQRAEAFRVAHVQLPPQPSLTLREPLIGTNLWDLDLRALAEHLKRQQPWLKEVRVVRVLPDTIRVDAIPRTPVAQVRIDRWYPVDREGFILPAGSPEPADRLIHLVGFERAGVTLRAGQDNTDARLKLALRILEMLRHAPPLISRRLTEVNVADPQAIRFLMDGQTEVRCGSEAELEAHLKRLQATLKAIARQQLAVRYIDVRFREPVVGSRSS